MGDAQRARHQAARRLIVGPSRPVILTALLRAGRRVSHAARPRVGEGVWMTQTAIVAAAAIGMFVAVLLLVLGMSRRLARPVRGHRPPARQHHGRPGPQPPVPASWDGAEPTRSFGYGPPSLWGDVPDDPRGWR
jgi:hypothetical protein